MHPRLIQGGMGVGVSGWRLANTVAAMGQLGVVSGTAVAVTEARRLMVGDPTGELREALAAFPVPAVADRVLRRYFSPGGPSAKGSRFRGIPRPTVESGRSLEELTVVANFAHVWLARRGHVGPVGINYLEKIQLPTLPSLYGAMLAGVDYVLMGAGMPTRIPSVLDRLAMHAPAALPLSVSGPRGDRACESTFDPADVMGTTRPQIVRPTFLAIVSSSTLATFLHRSDAGGPDGFVVEQPTAGGHNAPPRGRVRLDDDGQPVYGPRDVIDVSAICELGLPFWLAGGYGTPEGLAAAREQGAEGVQVGTAFAFCDESGIDASLRRRTIGAVLAGAANVRTDPKASPTGYPFKVVELEGTTADPEIYRQRPRRCDLGYLRELYRREDGRVGYRCPAEPVADYLAKGGDLAETEGRHCLCNALVANVGLGQTRPDGYAEPALLTAGDGLADIARFVRPGGYGYSARDVVEHILGGSCAS